mgnify:CR=1 FL=1
MMLYGKMGIGMMELQNAMLAVQDNTTVKELTKVMGDDSVSNEKKTSFLLQYLLDQREPLLRFGQTLLIALIVFVIGRKMVKLLLRFTDRWMERRNVEVSVRKFVMSLAGVIYNVLLIFVVAGILGVGTSSIVAMVGSAGLAIGLALILLLKPFQVGDYIITPQSEGTVQSIDIFYTRLTTTDNRVIVIPNGTISNSDITNTTKQDRRLLVLEFSVSYDADVALIRDILLKEMKHRSDILVKEPMRVVVTRLSPVKLRMNAKCWVETSKYWDVYYDMLERIKTLLQEQNISIG